MTLLWVLTTNFFEGLPFYIVRQVSTVYFKDQGMSLQAIGMASLLGLPWTLKFLWSPWLDTLSTRRRWVLMTEWLLTIFATILLITVFFKSALAILLTVFFLMALASATHDMSVDGFYMQALDEKTQAKYVGLRVAAYRVAMITGAGAIVGLSDSKIHPVFGWTLAFGVAALIMFLLTSFHQIVLPKEQDKGAVTKEKLKFIDAFKSYLRLPESHMLIAFALLFKIGDSFMFAMTTPFLLDAGISKAQLSIIAGTLGVIAAIVGSMWGGALIAKRGLKWSLWKFTIFQNISIPLYAVAAYCKVGVYTLGAVHTIEQLSAGFGTALYFSFFMRNTANTHKASHFAISTALMALSAMVAGTISGFIAAMVGYANYFVFSFLVAIPGMYVLYKISHRIK